MASTMNQLSALTELLKPKEDEDDDINERSNKPSFSPGNIGPPKQSLLHQQDGYSKDIWDVEEVADTAHDADSYDPRPEPKYDMIFKQAITSEDMFLQMSNRNPSTASCEDIVVKIQLPNTKYQDVELDVTDKFVDCRTPKFKLGLHLPHKVDSSNGKAQWDNDKKLLTITLSLAEVLPAQTVWQDCEVKLSFPKGYVFHSSARLS